MNIKKEELEILKVRGKELEPYVEKLAELRIKVFFEFPYLYDGDLDYERKYLKTYVNSKQSVALLVFKDQRLVGASTGLPLVDETSDFQKPFVEKSYDLNSIFYFGESIVLKEARGNKLGHLFFKEREKHAREVMGDLKITCFCAVERDENHPLKPENYKPLYEFWNRMGYEKVEALQSWVSWKDRNKSEEDKKPLSFWIKHWN